MRKLRSKKGLTLVELLVTVAVLGIVSGFSITIVVTAMNNYTEAAIVQKEQDTALLLEEYLVRNARVARQTEYITNDQLLANEHQGFYVAKINNVIETFDYAGMNAEGYYNYATDSNPQKYTRFTYENVQKITLKFSRQKRDASNVENGCVYFLDYTIAMLSGYKLSGQVVMNNADAEHLGALQDNSDPAGGEPPDSFVDTLAEYTLIDVTDTAAGYVFSPDYNTAVVFQ